MRSVPSRSVAAAIVLALAVTVIAAAGCGSKGEIPRIENVSPDNVAPGQTMAVEGRYFGGTQGKGRVLMSDREVTVEGWSDSQIDVKVPTDMEIGVQGVTVVTESGTSEEFEFEVIAPAGGDSRGSPDSGEAVEAIGRYMSSQGIDPQGWTITVVRRSDKEPDWKVDKASRQNQEDIYFLLRYTGGEWKVESHSTEDIHP